MSERRGVATLKRALAAVERGRHITEGKRWVLVAAVALFVATSVIGIATLPDLPERPRPVLLLLVGLLALGTLLANGLEFAVAGRMVGRSVGLPVAIQTSVLSSAANVLPIPGAVLIRVRALREADVPYKKAFAATAAVGLAWVGTSAAVAGGLLIWQDKLALGAAFTVLGTGAVLAAPLLTRSEGRDRSRLLLELVAVELGSVIVTTLRLYVIAVAVGYDMSLSVAATLGLSGVLASAAGLFPGGLGLREGLSAALAPLVDLNASVAIVVSAIDRVVFYVVLALVTLALLPSARRQRLAAAADAAEALDDPTSGSTA